MTRIKEMAPIEGTISFLLQNVSAAERHAVGRTVIS